MPRVGPTQGAHRHEDKVNRWKSRPRLAKALRALILVLPIATSIAFTLLAGRLFSAEDLGMGRWTWIAMIFILANVLLAIVRRVTSRLIPLVALMKLTLVFPDHAPSRAKATLRKSNSRTMLRNMEEARARGEQTGETTHGDYLVQLLTEVNEHDRLTRGHSERVRSYAEMLGEELKLSDDEMNKLRWSALLHDVGKISVPSEILNKDGRPTDDEWKILSSHPAEGGRMLEPLRPWLGDWVHSADQHHCRWDGKGYPETLAKEEISLAGRLIAIADAYDVMTSARSYKKPLPVEVARQELTDCAGSQFDPNLVRAFLQIGLTRLTTVTGPLAWLANLTGSLQLPVPAAGVVGSGAVSASVTSAGIASAGIAVVTVGGLVPPPEPEPQALAFEEPAPVVETEIEDLTVEPIEIAGLEGGSIEIVLTASGGIGDLTFSIVTPPNHGDASVIDEPSPTDSAFVPDVGTGWETTILYVPTSGYFGPDRIVYEVCDSTPTCETHTATISVSSSNRPPIANTDVVELDAGLTIEIDVLSNDTDPDGDALSIQSVGEAQHGQLTATGPSVIYRADEEFDGLDQFDYTIVDPEGATATGTVSLTVTAPTTVPSPTTTTIPSTTTTPSSTTTSAPTSTAPTTTTTAAPVNVAPVVINDVADVAEDESVVIPVLTNDRDPEGGTLTLASVSTPSNGVAVIESGEVRYSPAANFTGSDTFDYVASDGTATTQGTVIVTVNPVNDPPSVTATAVDVPETAPLGTTAFSIAASDIDGDTLAYAITSGDPTNLFAINADGVGITAGSLDFESQALYALDITVSDGTVDLLIPIEVSVLDVNERPTAQDDLLATTEDQSVVFSAGTNDDDPDGDVLSWQFPATTDKGVNLTPGTNGDVSYTPAPNASGADLFTYTVTDPDGLVSAPATVTIMIVAENDPPAANADSGASYTTTVNVPFTTADVTANDTDIDSAIDASSAAVVDDVTNGSLNNNFDGTFDYAPDPGWSGTDTFTYTITDSDGATSTKATVSIDVTIVAVADAGGPYSIIEGDDLQLDGSASTGSPTGWNWDLDNDGQYDDATGVTPLVPWATLYGLGVDDDGTYTVGLEVDGDTTTATLTIDNLDPVLTTAGAGTFAVNQPYTLNLSSTDPGNDLISSWTINWGDGTIDTILGNPSSATHTYTTGNFTYDILASATDEDGTVLQNDLLVPSLDGDSMFRFAATTGSFLQTFASGDDPIEALIDPDGNLLVSADTSSNVMRHDTDSGAIIDEFVGAGSGGLSGAIGLAHGPDGNLYVSELNGSRVLRYDGSTGAFIDIFATTGLYAPYDLVFGQDSNLYVGSYSNASISRFDGLTGAYIDDFVSSGSGGLALPEQMAFGPDGHLYVASFGTGEVLRYDGSTGAFIDTFVASGGTGDLDQPTGLAFGPDGNLYVGDYIDHAILRFDGATGAFIDDYVASGSGGLTRPSPMTFVASSRVRIDGNTAPEITDPGSQSAITGDAYSLQIVATDLQSATLAYGATGLPGGLTIDSSGLLSGTPSASGTFPVTITATDDGSPALSDSVTFTLSIEDYQVSSLAGTLHLTEVLYVGTAVPTEEFVELTNSGSTPIDLTGFRLADHDLKNDAAQNLDYTFPATDHWGTTSILQPGEQAVIWVSYNGITLPPVTNPPSGLEFVINNGGAAVLDNLGDSVWLLETSSLIIDYMAYWNTADTPPPASLNLWDNTDQGSLFVVAVGRSLALTPHNVDGDTASCWEESGSGAAATRCADAPATVDSPAGGLRHSAGHHNNLGSLYGTHVVISEFSNTGGADNATDFVELYNPTAANVDIEGWQLEIADDAAIVQTILLTGPNTVLPPGGHYLLDTAGSGDQTIVAMPDELAIRIRDGVTAVDEVGTRQRNNGGSLNAGLWSEGTGVPPLVDQANYEQSYERLLGSGHGNCVDTDDNSTDFERRLSTQVNPQSSADPVELCGVYPPTTSATHLVISEYRTDGPDGGGDEIVEIFNPTSTSISLNGYELRKEGNSGNEYTFPNIDLAPGQSYLTGGNSYAGPVDGTHNGFGNGDGVELYDTTGGTIIDVIVIGTSAPDLPRIDGQVDQSYQRRLSGCFHTGVLIDDFTLSGSPTPRLSTDLAIPC